MVQAGVTDEKSIYTLADAYLAGFSDGSKIQKAIDKSPAELVENQASRNGYLSNSEKEARATIEKEELADAAVEWALNYLAQEEQVAGSPDSGISTGPGEVFVDAMTVIHPPMEFCPEGIEFEGAAWNVANAAAMDDVPATGINQYQGGGVGLVTEATNVGPQETVATPPEDSNLHSLSSAPF